MFVSKYKLEALEESSHLVLEPGDSEKLHSILRQILLHSQTNKPKRFFQVTWYPRSWARPGCLILSTGNLSQAGEGLFQGKIFGKCWFRRNWNFSKMCAAAQHSLSTATCSKLKSMLPSLPITQGAWKPLFSSSRGKFLDSNSITLFQNASICELFCFLNPSGWPEMASY